MEEVKSIDNVIEKDLLHVFIINSPMVVFVAKLLISTYGLKKENIVCYRLRKTDVSLLNCHNISNEISFFDRLFKRLTYRSSSGLRIKRSIERMRRRFILYSGWDIPEVVEVLNSRLCAGQAYLEEGQMAYNEYEIYSYNKDKSMQKKRLKEQFYSLKRISPQTNEYEFQEYFNSRAFAFFGILHESFPHTPSHKRVILNNFADIKMSYKPKLLGVKNIGLTCSPRRLLPEERKGAMKKLVSKLLDGGVIKLHPDFINNRQLKKEMVRLIEEVSCGKVAVCCDSILIEAEMLFEEKLFFGPLTSTERYAKALGSKFEAIKLY